MIILLFLLKKVKQVRCRIISFDTMLEMSAEQIFGIVAGIMSFTAYLLYTVSMVRGKCRPNRMTWMTLTVIGLGLAISYYASGARETMWTALSYFAGPLIISLFSIKYGEGGWDPLDRWCIAGVVISLLLWWIFNSPLISLVANLFVDLLALIPTIHKSIVDPKGEDRKAWALETTSNIVNLLAIRTWTFAIISYPIYLVMVNMVITIALWWPRKKIK